MRYITLNEAEKQELENLHKTSNNFVVRERCLCLLLSAKGNSMVSVASLMNINKQTVRRLVHKWDESDTSDKFSALYSAKGQGAKMKLDPVSELLPELVEKHSRNLKPILAVLENEHSIKVSKQTLQNFLKGAGL
jgi:transposase